MGEKFKLNFITNGEGLVEIDEPIGFDSADFTLKQESKRYGRDVSFAGGESEFKFNRGHNHSVDLLIYYYETFGWESEVQLIIEVDGFDSIIGDFDFFHAKTDLIKDFSCKVVQSKSQALIKKRENVKVNLFSDKDVDDNDIEPLVTENVLIKAKPIRKISTWETEEIFFNEQMSADGFGARDTEWYIFNPTNLQSYDIDDSYQYFQPIIGRDSPTSINNDLEDSFISLKAINNLKDITINITNLDYILSPYKVGGDGYVEYRFNVCYGENWEDSTKELLFSGVADENQTISENSDYTISIPYLNRNDKIWVYFWYKVRKSSIDGQKFVARTTINAMDVSINATSTSYNTICPSIRLKDAVSYNVKSICGLDTVFPIADVNGSMYNQRVINGNALRNIPDKPFYFSMKEINEWLPEINGDSEVADEVYIGIYDDFYKNIECGYFDTVKFDDYEKSFNERYAINQFNYKYSKYQSQKENEIENTYDAVHGESEWLLGNVFVENKKDVKVGFVRDAFLIAETQEKSLEQTETTTTQEDDTIFILDTIESVDDYIFKEVDYIQHVYKEDDNVLELNNDGNFSFLLIGVTANTDFKILGDDPNAGTYNVVEVSERKLTLESNSGTVDNNGDRITEFEYVVTKETAPYKLRGSEGFNIIDGVSAKDDYANLVYTVKRNIINFWSKYLATANIYTKKAVKNTYYKNNPDGVFSYEGLTTIEGDDFTPENPILSPHVHKITLITDFTTYKNLENKIKTERGFITVWDREDFLMKVYPKEMKYKNSANQGELTIIGEERLDTSLINIVNNGIPYIEINSFYKTSKIIFEEKREKFYIFDENGRLLYNPTFWHKITVNGANATSKEELIEWLTLIS